MANGDRTKRLVANVQRALGNHGDKEESSPAAIYDALERVQRRICEDTLCLEDRAYINVKNGIELYDTPGDFIAERMLIPDASSIPIELIDLDRVDSLKRSANASEPTSDSSADSVYYYYHWGDQIGFLGSDGSSPSGDSTINIYYYRYPSRTTDKPSLTKDPVVNERWDTALFYGSVAELSAHAGWYEKFELEYQRQRRREVANRNTPGGVAYNEDYD